MQAAYANMLCKQLLRSVSCSSQEHSVSTESSETSADTLLYYAEGVDVFPDETEDVGFHSAECMVLDDKLGTSSCALKSDIRTIDPFALDASLGRHAVLGAGDGRATWVGPTCFAPPVVTAGLSAMVLAGLATMSCAAEFQ